MLDEAGKREVHLQAHPVIFHILELDGALSPTVAPSITHAFWTVLHPRLGLIYPKWSICLIASIGPHDENGS